MTENYQQLITERVRDGVNTHLEHLKAAHPDMLLTRQWRIIWPRGFEQGQNILPVVTSSREGQYLIGEVQMVLPASLDLDLDAVELALKDEPYRPPEKTSQITSLNDPLDLLNELVLGVNGFLTSLSGLGSQEPYLKEASGGLLTPLKVHNSGGVQTVLPERVDEVRQQMQRSSYLPEWFQSIEDDTVAQSLLTKLAEGYLQHCRRTGRQVSLKDYFEQYTDYLQKEGRLYHHCSYKGRAVKIDGQGRCTEPYCSKKPYDAKCNVPQLRFGTAPDT